MSRRAVERGAGGRPVVLAAGGTGGHMFPAEAVAGELAARGHRLVVVTDRRGRGFGGGLAGLETHEIQAEGVSGRSLYRRCRGLARLGVGYLQARRLLARLSPGAVVGFGGYAAFPTMLAAVRAGHRTVLHEQNAILGRANRMLAARVDLVATTFEPTAGLDGVPRERIVRTGNPVRPPVAALADSAYPPLAAEGDINILVLGGSQGASVFARVVPAAMSLLPEPMRRRLNLWQQCRPEDIEAVRRAYGESGIRAGLAPFIDDVPARMAAAHLLICRAGASTVAEIMAIGRPAILVPYPHAVDDHQSANAHAVDEAGGGWLMPEGYFTPEALAERLSSLFAMPEILPKAAASARAAGRPDAAVRLADAVERLLDPNGETAEQAGGAPAPAVREAAE